MEELTQLLQQIATSTQNTAANTAQLKNIDRSVLEITRLLEELRRESEGHNTVLNAILQQQQVLVTNVNEQGHLGVQYAMEEREYRDLVREDVEVLLDSITVLIGAVRALAVDEGHGDLDDLDDSDEDDSDDEQDGGGGGGVQAPVIQGVPQAQLPLDQVPPPQDQDRDLQGAPQDVGEPQPPPDDNLQGVAQDQVAGNRAREAENFAGIRPESPRGAALHRRFRDAENYERAAQIQYGQNSEEHQRARDDRGRRWLLYVNRNQVNEFDLPHRRPPTPLEIHRLGLELRNARRQYGQNSEDYRRALEVYTHRIMENIGENQDNPNFEHVLLPQPRQVNANLPGAAPGHDHDAELPPPPAAPPQANLPGQAPTHIPGVQPGQDLLGEIAEIYQDAQAAERDYGPNSMRFRGALGLLRQRAAEYEHRNDPNFVYVPPDGDDLPPAQDLLGFPDDHPPFIVGLTRIFLAFFDKCINPYPRGWNHLDGLVPHPAAPTLEDVERAVADVHHAQREHGPGSERVRVTFARLVRRWREYEERYAHNFPALVIELPGWAGDQVHQWGFQDDEERRIKPANLVRALDWWGNPLRLSDYKRLIAQSRIWNDRREGRWAMRRIRGDWAEILDWRNDPAQACRSLGDLLPATWARATSVTRKEITDLRGILIFGSILSIIVFIMLKLLLAFADEFVVPIARIFFDKYIVPHILDYFAVLGSDPPLDAIRLENVIARNPDWERILREL